MQINTSDLLGSALDWAVGIAVMGRPTVTARGWIFLGRDGVEYHIAKKPHDRLKTRASWAPSLDWSQGGPLIDERIVCIEHHPLHSEPWAAWASAASPGECGHNLLTASMRAIVRAEIGEIIDVPYELSGGA